MITPTLPPKLDQPTVYAALELALREDLGDPSDPSRDVTSIATLSADALCTATLFAKEKGVIAALPLVGAICEMVDDTLSVELHVADGESVAAGDPVATVSGSAQSAFMAERTALNLLGRCSGIATLTRQFVDAVAGTDATILDTRKTTPGLRQIEKYAVLQGGGQNHRFGLYDMVLIKDNHIAASGGITQAVERVRNMHGDSYPVEVEVTSLNELQEALAVDVDRIMLDNMDLESMRRAVEITDGAVPLEASGNVTLDSVREIAETDVDFISVGALTHSVSTLDLSLRVQ